MYQYRMIATLLFCPRMIGLTAAYKAGLVYMNKLLWCSDIYIVCE